FQERFFEVSPDCHDFPCRFHLRPEFSVARYKFIEWKPRYFRDDVVQSRLKESVSRPGDRIDDFIECKPDSYFSSNFCNRIACRFRRQCRGAADARIHFNDEVIETIGVKGQLYVAAPFNFKSAYQFKRYSSQKLM